MFVRTNRYPEVATLRQCIERAEEQINTALDHRDRKAFKVWSLRRSSLCGRLSTLLLKIAQAPEV
jgi:hypothetical protein